MLFHDAKKFRHGFHGLHRVFLFREIRAIRAY